MEMRLNKLLGESGLCSRREADKFIETGRVTVNGKPSYVGQKVTESDDIQVDGEQVATGKYFQEASLQSDAGKAKKPAATKLTSSTATGASSSARRKKFSSPAELGAKGATEATSSAVDRPAKYGKYNKYAAARKIAKAREAITSKRSADGDKLSDKIKKSDKGSGMERDKLLKEALRPQFGKSVSRSAVAQRMAASPKSAALRKTSRNNPLNKAKRGNRNQTGNK